MSVNLKSKSVLVYDLGLFSGITQVLAPAFGKTYYYCPGAESPFPQSNPTLVGRGLPGVERVANIWTVIDEVDLFVFTDVGSGDLQAHLRDLGKRVWGCGRSEWLELDRVRAKKELSAAGISIGRYTVLRGKDELVSHLKAHKNQWIKVSAMRGDFETFFAASYDKIKRKIEKIFYKLGEKANFIEFICEDAIVDAVEIAYDGPSVDGQFPNMAPCGIEVKDKGYIGWFKDYNDLPEVLLESNRQWAPLLKEYECRSWAGMEGRITKDGTFYVIDPIMRFGSPPGELVKLWVENMPEVLWHGAEGEMIDLIPTAKCGAELLIHSDWADQDWETITYPDAIAPNVKLRNWAKFDDPKLNYVVPQSVGLPEAGAVSAVGDTLEEAIEKCKEYADQIQGISIHMFQDTMEEAMAQMEKLKSFGIDLEDDGGYLEDDSRQKERDEAYDEPRPKTSSGIAVKSRR